MAEFANNNVKTMSISHTPFELHCSYYFRIFYKEDIDSYFKSKSTDKLLIKL